MVVSDKMWVALGSNNVSVVIMAMLWDSLLFARSMREEEMIEAK